MPAHTCSGHPLARAMALGGIRGRRLRSGIRTVTTNLCGYVR
jgi:hypothetical protein